MPEKKIEDLQNSLIPNLYQKLLAFNERDSGLLLGLRDPKPRSLGFTGLYDYKSLGQGDDQGNFRRMYCFCFPEF